MLAAPLCLPSGPQGARTPLRADSSVLASSRSATSLARQRHLPLGSRAGQHCRGAHNVACSSSRGEVDGSNIPGSAHEGGRVTPEDQFSPAASASTRQGSEDQGEYCIPPPPGAEGATRIPHRCAAPSGPHSAVSPLFWPFTVLHSLSHTDLSRWRACLLHNVHLMVKRKKLWTNSNNSSWASQCHSDYRS